jgi:uncharacterized protein (DUF1499 family)
MRYPTSDEPYSQLAIWARRLAVFSLTATLLGVVVVRSGMLDLVPALATLGGAIALAIAAMLLAIGAFAVIWKDGLKGFGYALTAMLIGIALLGYPAYLAGRAYWQPAIYDITTDPIDPPRFEAIARLRPRDANDIRYAGLYTAEQQREAYADIEPIEAAATAQKAFEAAIAVATKRKWRVVDARAPQALRRDGHIEAIARTPVLGFRDDVVIRVRPTRDGVRVDLRSASRYGRHDFGANAARVRGFIEEFDEALAALTPDKRNQPTPKSTQKGTQKGSQKSTQATGKGAPAKR